MIIFNKRKTMDVSTIKSRLHQLIDQTNDEDRPAYIYRELLQEEDWMDSLSSEQRLRLEESQEQYKKGKIISNDDVLKRIQQWLQK